MMKKSVSGPGLRNQINRLWHSVWLFPVALAIIFLLLVGLKISGSSIGEYHDIFYGKTSDPSLLLNHPEGIRSDEWLVTTQLTIGQSVAGYPRVNPNIDSGRDMTVVGDAPAKDWSTIFRPQNLPFFFMPLAFAFAFKWWLLLYLVIVSAYFLTLRVLGNKLLLASILGVAFGLSPFIFWWYTTGTLATLAYGFFIVLISMRIINSEDLRGPDFIKKRSSVVYALGLAYLLTAFALVLYPPFQIPVAIATLFVVAGLLLDRFGLAGVLKKDGLRKISVFAAGGILALVLVFAFFHTRQNVVHDLTSTVYPGNRKVEFQGNSLYEIFSTYLMPQLQRISRAAHYYTNQSEASNFILLLPFLYIPSFALLWARFRQTKKINWPLLTTQLAITLFGLYLFVPALHPLYSLIKLDKVANSRLFIGLGFVGFIQLLYFMAELAKLKVPTRKLNVLGGTYLVVCIGTMMWAGVYTRSKYPQFIYSWALIGLFIAAFSLILYLFMTNRRLLGATIFLLFTVASVFHVHPLYRGMGPVYNSAVIQAMDKASKPGDTWATMDSLYYENFALMANRDSLSGIKPYPDVAYWRQVAGSKDDYVYNRYAHVLFNDQLNTPLYLAGPDSFQVQLACTPFILHHLNYVLSVNQLSQPCLQQINTVSYPAVVFYIYRVNPAY